MFLHGPDTYRSRERLRTLRDAFIAKHDPSGVNVIRLEGAQLTVEQFNAAVKSQGLLSGKRLVIVERLLTENRKKNIATEIANYLGTETIPDDTILIFWEGEVGATAASKKRQVRTKKKTAPATDQSLFMLLSKQKHVEYFELLAPAQLRQWISTQTKALGAQIDPAAMALLAEHAGADLWRLRNEISVLASYRQGEIITSNDVRLFSPAVFQETIFTLTDALGERRRTDALRLMHSFLDRGEPPLYILSMLIRQFRILVNVSLTAAAEPNYQTVARRLGLHPFVAQKALTQVSRFKFTELKTIYDRLVSLDRRFKTSREDPALLFDQFIIAASA